MNVIECVDDPFKNSKNICFDIETSGLNAASDDEVTVIGFKPDQGTVLFLVNKQFFDDDVDGKISELSLEGNVLTFDSEKDLLNTGLKVVLDNVNGKNHRLYAYNGKTWKGGFDIPFLRTRCIKNNIDWLFDGKYYFDVYPAVRDDINTCIENGDENNDLDSAHEVLCSNHVEDPFEDSSEALDETVDKVVEHCYKDILRTEDVFNVVMDYTSAREPKELQEAGYL